MTVKASSEAWGDLGFPRSATISLTLCLGMLFVAIACCQAHLLTSSADVVVLAFAVIFFVYISVVGHSGHAVGPVFF